MGAGQGNAIYVAVERVTGSFALAHKGIMDAGKQSLEITIVLASGTDALAGITGRLTILIKVGGHFYTHEYSLN